MLSIFCYHICDHVFSYSSDYGVVISCTCSVLSVDRGQLPEQEKYLVAYVTKSGACCNLNILNSDIQVHKISYRQQIQTIKFLELEG